MLDYEFLIGFHQYVCPLRRMFYTLRKHFRPFLSDLSHQSSQKKSGQVVVSPLDKSAWHTTERLNGFSKITQLTSCGRKTGSLSSIAKQSISSPLPKEIRGEEKQTKNDASS